MYLRALQLRQFRNYDQQLVCFEAPKTILVGDNAQGKTNLLEAVELLTTLRSRRVTRDRDLVRWEQPQASITAQIERVGIPHELKIQLRSSGRRTLQADGQTQARQMDFLGQVNGVVFSSLDLQLVQGGPDQRRSWLDDVLVQLEPLYAHLLAQYRRVLKQRNALLKQQREHLKRGDPWSEADPQLAAHELGGWDQELAVAGGRLMRRRARLLERLNPLADRWHQAISGGREVLQLTYQPQVPLPQGSEGPDQVQDLLLQAMTEMRSAERAYGSSLVGPHRDEVELVINGTPARLYGSQGQQRTLVLALKLAELELIEQVIGDPPLLLLDDVLAELDPYRQDQLLDAIQNRVQTLVTTTHLGSFKSRWLESAQVMKVNQGSVQLVKANI